jgi:hypothetical protein
MTPSQRIGVLWRLPIALAGVVPGVTAVIGAAMLIVTCRQLAMIGMAAFPALATGISQAHVASVVGHYLAAFLGAVGIATGVLGRRSSPERSTSPPPAWYYLLVLLLAVLPTALLWGAVATLLASPTGEPLSAQALVDRAVTTLWGTLAAGLVAPLILFALAVAPLRTAAGRSTRALLAAWLFAASLIALAVALHVRLLALRQAALSGNWSPGP